MDTTRGHAENGSVLVAALILVTMLAAMAMTFATRISTNEMKLEGDIDGAQALQLAQAANDAMAQRIWVPYRARRTDQRVAWLGGEDQNANGTLDPGEDANYNTQLDGPAAPGFSDAAFTAFGRGTTKSTVSVVNLNKKEWVDIKIETQSRIDTAGMMKDPATGNWVARHIERKIERVIRYGLEQAKVFDYVYFANNYGWMYGSTLRLYGAMGANGNLGFSGTPTIDGNLFAALNTGLGAAGVVNGTARHDSLSQYRALGAGNSLMRPTNPAAPPEDLNGNGVLDSGEDANGNGKLDMYEYEVGYDGNQPREERSDLAEMPYLGDLEMYRDLARAYSRPARPDLGQPTAGTGSLVKQLKAPGLDPTDPDNYNVLIDQTYGYDASQNGKYSTVDGTGAVAVSDITKKLDTSAQEKNGNLALIGTEDQPIVIMGPVVVSNDLVIKGVVKGQGTFYVGRNTNIVGDLTYSDPPAWTQDDTNFENTAASNKLKDGVGFGTKGNVVLGDYTESSLSGGTDSADSGGKTDGSWTTATNYMKPSFTKSYVVDAADASNGYVTSTVAGQPTFDGNYTNKDTGKKYDDFSATPTTATRRFYESSFPIDYIKSIAKKPTKLQGIFYTNHYFGGRTSKLKMYGNLVTRDEGIVTDSSADFYYDPRISKGELSSYIELFLPRNAAYSILLYREVPATDN